MRAVNTLPENYRPVVAIDLAKDRRMLLWMNLAAVIAWFLSAWLFLLAAHRLRPGGTAVSLRLPEAGISSIPSVVLGLLLIFALMIVLHEGAHGLIFWMFTRSRPVFALRGYYAYAAAPGWYLLRDQYLVVALAPLLLLDAAALGALLFVPPGWIPPLLVFTASNTAGSLADIYVAARVTLHPRQALVHDEGDRFTLYLPVGSAGDT